MMAHRPGGKTGVARGLGEKGGVEWDSQVNKGKWGKGGGRYLSKLCVHQGEGGREIGDLGQLVASTVPPVTMGLWVTWRAPVRSRQ